MATEVYRPAPNPTPAPRLDPGFLYPPAPRPLAGPSPERNSSDWYLNCHGSTSCCNCAAGVLTCFDPRTCGT